jgi:hypothetical protein
LSVPGASWAGLSGNNRYARAGTGGIERIRLNDDLRYLIAPGHPAAFQSINDDLGIAFPAGQGLEVREKILFIVGKVLNLFSRQNVGVQALRSIDDDFVGITNNFHRRRDPFQGHGDRQRRHVLNDTDRLAISFEIGRSDGDSVQTNRKVEGKRAEVIRFDSFDNFPVLDDGNVNRWHRSARGIFDGSP